MRTRPNLGLLLLLALLLGPRSPAIAAPAAAEIAVTQEFVSALHRARMDLPETPDSPALQAYVLYDYLVAARLHRDLNFKPSEELDARIDAFLAPRIGQPATRALRRDWLASLAERRRWDWFLARAADATDPMLICDRLQGRLASGDLEGLGAAALARWSLPQRQPVECHGVFGWLKQEGLITPALAEARVRAALMADNPRLAREYAADVPLASVTALLQWSDLLESPRSALNVLAGHPNLPVDPEALAAGFEKLARTDYNAAFDLLPQLLARPGLAPATQDRLQRAAALGAAYAHDPRALIAFNGLNLEGADTAVYEWRVRAAVWNGDFAKALAWTESMPPALAAQPRWRYWHARAVADTAGAEAAAPLFAEIAALRDYYGYLAADRLHQSYKLNARASADDAAAQTALVAQPGMLRARALLDCGMTEEAAVEWAAALANATPALKVQAAHIASRWGWYAQAIATLAQASEWDDVRLRYPRPYVEQVAEASKLSQVPADWIFGVMRQESLYRKDAVSRADARGLMQMLPSTAIAVAHRWHMPPITRDTLFDPESAVPLGAAYLREMLDRYGGQLYLCLAAYNAGPGAVQRWLPHRAMDADVWVENIPYNETRAYVQHILEHIVAFAWVRDAEPPRLNALMPALEPAAPVSGSNPL